MSGSTEIITTFNDNDIICGRKGVALKHPGNIAYRKIVSLNKELYATCMKNEKLRISKSVVSAMREAGGRFLEREDGKTSSSLNEKDAAGNPIAYRDIGDKRAVEKTSQALREGQPKLLKKLAQKQKQDAAQQNAAAVASSQALHYHQASMAAMQPPIPQPPVAAAPRYSYNPYAYVQQPILPPQSVTPPPPPSSLLSPTMYSQLETDLLFLELLRRARGSGL